MPYRATLPLSGLLFALSAIAAPPPAESVPTTDQIYASFEDADYPKVLKQVAAALSVKGDASWAYDRHELLVLRGEAQLRLKNTAAAAAAFDEAAKHTKLEEKAGVDRATAELIRRSKKGLYTPPAKDGGPAPRPLDVTDPAARGQAFAAMFDAARPRVVAAFDAARKSDNLPAMLEAFGLLRDLRALETAATGTDAESTAMANDLGARAREVMGRAVAEMGDTVAALEQEATRYVRDVALVAGRMVSRGSGAAGLWPESVRRLRQIASDSGRIRDVASGLRSIYDADSEEGNALRALCDDAREVEDGARHLLRINWRDHYQQDAYVGPGAANLDPSVWEQIGPPPPPSRLGTNWVRRPIRDNPDAGPRGVSTSGTR